MKPISVTCPKCEIECSIPQSFIQGRVGDKFVLQIPCLHCGSKFSIGFVIVTSEDGIKGFKGSTLIIDDEVMKR